MLTRTIVCAPVLATTRVPSGDQARAEGISSSSVTRVTSPLAGTRKIRPPAPSLTKRLPSSSAETPKGSERVIAEILGPEPATVTTSASGFGGSGVGHQRRQTKKPAAAQSKTSVIANAHRNDLDEERSITRQCTL